MSFIKRHLRRGAEKFERDSHAWNLTQWQAILIVAVPIVIVLVMAAAVPFFELYFWLTAEDSMIEWLQFLLLLAAGLIFARMGLRLTYSHGHGLRLLYLIVALGTFFIAGEEISWGQRIFGWETPETLATVNYQNETTFHNIGSAHQPFIYAVMLGGMYGTLIPLLWLAFWNERPHSPLSALFVPPLCLVPAFVMPFGYRFIRLLFDLDTRFPRLIFPITSFSEVTELCLYFGVLVLAWLNLRRRQPEVMKLT